MNKVMTVVAFCIAVLYSFAYSAELLRAIFAVSGPSNSLLLAGLYVADAYTILFVGYWFGKFVERHDLVNKNSIKTTTGWQAAIESMQPQSAIVLIRLTDRYGFGSKQSFLSRFDTGKLIFLDRPDGFPDVNHNDCLKLAEKIHDRKNNK